MRQTQDDVDVYMNTWARQRKIALGIINPNWMEPRERIGKLRCTLAVSKDERSQDRVEAVSEFGNREQDWPEVYTGMALVIREGLLLVTNQQRHAAHLRYVRTDMPFEDRYAEMGCSRSTFDSHVNGLKNFFWGYLAGTRGTVLTRKEEGFHRATPSKYEPHQGQKEIERRRLKILTLNRVKG